MRTVILFIFIVPLWVTVGVGLEAMNADAYLHQCAGALIAILHIGLSK